MNEENHILDGLTEVSLWFQSFSKPYKMGKKDVTTLVQLLSGVNDFRMKGKVKYPIENILAICFILAMQGRLKSFSQAYYEVKYDEEFFVKYKLIEKGKIPSHDTFRYIFMHIDANEFRDVFLRRIREFFEKIIGKSKKKTIISGDGKEFRGSGRHNAERNINVMNIYDASRGVCYSSTPLCDKDSEIIEMQRMIYRFDLVNTVVSGDALHCQRKTCLFILGKKGDFVFKVKDNQEDLKREIIAMFNKRGSKVDKLPYNNCDYEFIILDKDYAGCEWPGQKCYVRMLSHKRAVEGHKDDPEWQYFITSMDEFNLIAESIDHRWCIEDDLHRFKDGFFEEDSCTFMNTNAIKVMATINNTVYSFYRIASAVLSHESMRETVTRFSKKPIELLRTVLPLLTGQDLTMLIKQNMRGTKESKKH